MDHSRALGREWLLLLAVVGGAGAALFGSGHRGVAAAASPNSASAPSAPLIDDFAVSPIPGDSWTDGSDAAQPEEGDTVSGDVLEQIDVGQYSYLRLGEKGGIDIWAAVSSAPSRLGKRTTVTNAQLMTNFTSSTLKRTFPSIYFGAIRDESAAPASGQGQSPRPEIASGMAHIPEVTVPRARGPAGYSVAELNGAAAAAGMKVRVRGIVVKSTSGVLGRTFLHVQDGSGDVKSGNHDLAVTTTAEIPVHSEVELEGTLEVDRDFGAGYRYRVLLSDAAIVPAHSH
ncbi:MAG TPA: hypothetical protein VFQ61_19525 [Polyangiaceae bacterium]|nr:hypothetical protein [Polyangiaceae bacterium]